MSTDIYDETLQTYWGHEKLKPLQKKIIKALVEEKCDAMAILATSYGKSVTYQLGFALDQTKCVLVISPLIALMDDQVNNLNEKGLPAIALNSNMKLVEKTAEMSAITAGVNKIIYMSPEFVVKSTDFLLELYEEDRLMYVAIDEAHCVSSWGSDFRPDYKLLSCIKDTMPDINILAVTATATEKVKDDIAESLQLDDYYEFVSSFDRKNIFYECVLRSSDMHVALSPYLDVFNSKCCIIYGRTRVVTEQVTKMLKKMGVSVETYHAGLSSKIRQENQDKFAQGNINVLVCTCAFGLGIDMVIDYVFHWSAAPDLETYSQETGRAGRNGNEAKCITLYDKGDMRINRILLKDIKDPEYKKHRELQIKHMETFLRTNNCRRKMMLNYFGESYNKTNCGKCDNCVVDKIIQEGLIESLQYPMYLILTFIMYTKIYGGATKLINVLLGKKLAPLKQYHTCPFFSLGKGYHIAFWKEIVILCIHNDFLNEKTITSGFGVVLEPTTKLIHWYKTTSKILKDKDIKSFSVDDFLALNLQLETYEIPSTCDNLNRYIKKRVMTDMEQMIVDEMKR